MISGYLVGDRELVRTLYAMPASVKASIDREVQKQGYGLQARVQQAYLRGPRPTHLGVRTSRLIASIALGAAESRTRFVSGDAESVFYVGTNVPYGALWENGFKRKVGAGARGGPRTLTGRARDTYFSKHPPGIKDVGARPFLKPALFDVRQRFVDSMQSALRDAMVRTLKGR